MTTIIHTSDWHLGRSLHRADLTDYHESFLRWLLELAQDRAVDAVVVAGDIYDTAQPRAEVIELLSRTLADFARAGIPLIISSGNHDSAIRLRYGQELFADNNIHVRGSVADMTEPVVVGEGDNQVGVYAIPYLNPDAVREELEADRSHQSVLSAATDRIRQDAQARGLTRTVVAAHAFVVGGSVSDSERDIRVGGIGDVSASVFDGFTYVALGHLHRPQDVRLEDSTTKLAYSGSPLAFSFSERNHRKSITQVTFQEDTPEVETERIAVPGLRPLRQVEGSLEDLLAQASAESQDLREHWIKAILTDSGRPESPMAKLQNYWPHTLILDRRPAAAATQRAVDTGRPSEQDPARVTTDFVAEMTGEDADEATSRIIESVVETTGRDRGNA